MKQIAMVSAEEHRAKLTKRDERIVVLRDLLAAMVAVSPLAYDRDGSYCRYCQQSEWATDEHRPDCLWVRARAALGEE